MSFPSVLWHCWFDNGKGHSVVKRELLIPNSSLLEEAEKKDS